MAGYDIFVAVNTATLNPTSAALGSLIASPSLTSICINGVSKTGTCTQGYANGPGVVEVTTIESSGGNECGGIATCSGMAFTITYSVISNSENSAISFSTSANCVGYSSVASPGDVCVIVEDPFGNILPESIQSGTYPSSFVFSPASPQVGQNVTFTPSPTQGTPPFSFYWTFGDGATSNLTSPTHIYNTSGTFNVSVTITDSSTPPLRTTVVNKITVQPPDFSISANPSSVGPLAPSVMGHSNITITGISLFTGTVTLSLTPSPGLRVSLSANNIAPSSATPVSVVTVSVGAQTPGDYSLLIAGSSNGFHTHAVTVSVRVGDFQISGPNVINVLPSAPNGKSQLRVSSLFGFNDTVSLAWSSPSGLNATISPSSVTGSGVATITVGGVPGTYLLIITGSSSGFSSHTIFVRVNIAIDFYLSIGPNTSHAITNDFATSTVNITSINGFSGRVSLALIPSAGLVVSITSTSVTVAPGNPGICTLTVGAATAGNYSVIIVGSSDGLPTHTDRLFLTVMNDPPPRFIRVGLPSDVGFSMGSFVVSLSKDWLVMLVLGSALIAGVLTFKHRKRKHYSKQS